MTQAFEQEDSVILLSSVAKVLSSSGSEDTCGRIFLLIICPLTKPH
jgi:hypothetical protein